MKHHIKKYIRKIFVFVLVLLCCNMIYAKDMRMAIDERAVINETNPFNIRYNLDIELFDRGIRERFGKYVDDVFTISIEKEEDINCAITVEGKYFNLTPLIADVSIGSMVLLCTVSLPYIVVPLFPANNVVAIFAVRVGQNAAGSAIASLSGAAVDAGIRGVLEYF